jgi:uncharacterized protein (DUF427 family)
MVEGNHYFPADSVNHKYFSETQSHTVCPWKGTASYYTIHVDGAENYDAAWFYPNPSHAARIIKDYVAFWRGVEIIP